MLRSVRPERPLPDEPCTRRIVVPAYRRAVVDLFGDAGRTQVIALLDGDSRDEFVRDVTPNREWIPARHLIAWSFAVWEGPANRQREPMAELVRRQWDLSFGVVRKLLLHMASPSAIVARLPQIWKQDHTAGTLEAVLDDGGSGATLRMSDTPFIETPQARAGMAEIYRHAFAQTRARNVTETHALEAPNRMVLRLRWT